MEVMHSAAHYRAAHSPPRWYAPMPISKQSGKLQTRPWDCHFLGTLMPQREHFGRCCRRTLNDAELRYPHPEHEPKFIVAPDDHPSLRCHRCDRNVAARKGIPSALINEYSAYASWQE